MIRISDLIFSLSSLLLILIWQKSILHQHTTPLIGTLITIYLIISFTKINKHHLISNILNRIKCYILQLIIFIIILFTGGINSYLFPFLYFLSFAIAFSYKPSIVFIFISLLTFLLLPSILNTNILQNIIKLSSIILLSPFAYFFSLEFHHHLNNESLEYAETASRHITEDVLEITQNQNKNLQKDDLEKLNDIINQINKLKETYED